MVSRFERGFAPGMRTEKLVAIARALDRLFPFGTCPHDHECAWQPIRPPQHQVTAAEELIASILAPATEPRIQNTEPLRSEPALIDVSPGDLSHQR